MKKAKCFRTVVTILLALVFSVFVGCNKDAATEPDISSGEITPSSDAAESVASAVGENTGGMVDQVGDVLNAASTTGFQGLAKTDGSESVEAEYDPVTGIWTVVIERERGNPNGQYYAYIERTYTFQFLNAEGNPQKFWITNGDTAHTILFEIVSGDGHHKTPRLSHELKALSGSFVATNTHTDQVTINGTYMRAATDTVTTRNAERTLDYTLELQIIDLTGPRGSRHDLSKKVSGQITGTYTAFVTFTRGDHYREQTIERNINIILGGGEATVDVNGEKFKADVATGEVID